MPCQCLWPAGEQVDKVGIVPSVAGSVTPAAPEYQRCIWLGFIQISWSPSSGASEAWWEKGHPHRCKFWQSLCFSCLWKRHYWWGGFWDWDDCETSYANQRQLVVPIASVDTAIGSRWHRDSWCSAPWTHSDVIVVFSLILIVCSIQLIYCLLERVNSEDSDTASQSVWIIINNNITDISEDPLKCGRLNEWQSFEQQWI